VADVDFDAAERCFAPDALWHFPGRGSPIAGDHRGWAQIRDDFLANELKAATDAHRDLRREAQHEPPR